MAMLRRRWVLIVSLAVIGAPLAYAVAVLLPAKYKSQTLVLVEAASVPEDLVKPLDTSGLGQQLASMQQEILSRSRLEPIIRKYDLYPKEMNRASIDDLVARLQKNIEVSPILPMSETHARDLPGFNVTVTLDNPHTAQNVCADITSMFIAESTQLKISRGKGTTDFLEAQLKDAKANLDEQDAKLADFKVHHLGELPDDHGDVAAGCRNPSVESCPERKDIQRTAVGLAGCSLAGDADWFQSGHAGTPAGQSANAAGQPSGALYRRLSRRD
jgi:uncharacterized protein involved in exopolysaccharide biosynthesis